MSKRPAPIGSGAVTASVVEAAFLVGVIPSDRHLRRSLFRRPADNPLTRIPAKEDTMSLKFSLAAIETHDVSDSPSRWRIDGGQTKSRPG